MNLGAILGEEAIAYSTVGRYLRDAQTGLDDATALSEDISRHIDDSNEVILNAPEELLFSSVRELSLITRLPETTVYRRHPERFCVFNKWIRFNPTEKITTISIWHQEPTTIPSFNFMTHI
jgi:hypothetical protein